MFDDYKFDKLPKTGAYLWHNCGIYDEQGRIVFFGNLYDGMPALMVPGKYYVLEEPAVTCGGGQYNVENKLPPFMERWHVATIVGGVLVKHPDAVIRGMGPR